MGNPGQRTFHLRVLGEADQSASLKLEKEHLAGLLAGLRQVQAVLKRRAQPQAGDVLYFPPSADLVFAVGSLGLGFSKSDETFVIEARELADDTNPERTALRVRLSVGQAAKLEAQLEKIIAAGRPTCPLCGTPMDPAGHVCIRSNGHSRLPVQAKDLGEE